jgi:hypothetical protein
MMDKQNIELKLFIEIMKCFQEKIYSQYKNNVNKQLGGAVPPPVNKEVGGVPPPPPPPSPLVAPSGLIDLGNNTLRLINIIMIRSSTFIFDYLDNLILQGRSAEEAKEILKNKAEVLATVLSKLKDDPEFRELVKKSGNSFAQILGEFFEVVEPAILEVQDDVTKLLVDTSSEAAKGAAKTAVSLTAAFLAEIPYIGGFIDLIMTFGIGFNGFSKTFRTFVAASEPIVEQAVDTVERAAPIVENAKDTAIDFYEGAKHIASSLSNATSNSGNGIIDSANNMVVSAAETIEQSGGRKQKKRNRTRRINDSITRFKKTLRKQKYSKK